MEAPSYDSLSMSSCDVSSPQKCVDKRQGTTEHLNHRVAQASTVAMSATASLMGRTLSNASQACRRINSDRHPTNRGSDKKGRWDTCVSRLFMLFHSLSNGISRLHADAERCCKSVAQNMLEFSYMVVR